MVESRDERVILIIPQNRRSGGRGIKRLKDFERSSREIPVPGTNSAIGLLAESRCL